MRRLPGLVTAVVFLLASAGVATAAPGVRLAYERTATTLALSVTGASTRTATWQIEVRGVGRSDGHKVVISLSPTERGWTGAVQEQNRSRSGRWATARTMPLTMVGTIPINAQAINDPILGLVISTLSVDPPQAANRTLTVRLSLTRTGVRLRLVGAVRAAPGPHASATWIRTPAIIR